MLGTIALVIGAVAIVIRRRLSQREEGPGVGLLLAGAAWIAMLVTTGPAKGAGAGLLVLATAGLFHGRGRAPAVIPLVMATAGSCLLALTGGVPQKTWIRLLVASVVPPAALLVADFDARRSKDGRAPALFAVSAVGVFVTVPDTEHALALLGAAWPLALLSCLCASLRLGSAGAFAATGLLVWTVAVDGAGRHSSVVGGMACLGLLVIEPLLHRLPVRRTPLTSAERGRERHGRRMRVALVGVSHATFVFLSARVVGLRPSISDAVVLATVLLVATVVVGGLLLPSSDDRGHQSPI